MVFGLVFELVWLVLLVLWFVFKLHIARLPRSRRMGAVYHGSVRSAEPVP